VRFAVLGAGAIGAYVGAALARGGADVTLIACGDHLRAMADHGVRVHSPRGDFEAHPAATSELTAIADADVVVLGVKAYSLPALAPRIGELLRPDAVVVAAQNGIPWWYFQRHGGPLEQRILESVDPGGVVSRAIRPEQVVGCVVYCSTEIVEPGVIRHIEGTRFTIGTPDGVATERCREISQALVAAGLKCSFDEQLRRQIWLKLVGNAAFNPITTITRSTMGALRGSERALAYIRTVMEECAAVAGSVGVELPISIDRRLEAGLAVGDHRTSMLQDFEAGKRLELGCMVDAVVEVAAMTGTPVPNMIALSELTAALEQLRDAASP
jgi:2-dehydropantoate 2-reductase